MAISTRRVNPIGTFGRKRRCGHQWWLCHELRMRAAMRLGRMHEERMAEIDRARVAGGQAIHWADERSRRNQSALISRSERPASPAGARRTCDLAMRAGANAGGRVVLADIGDRGTASAARGRCETMLARHSRGSPVGSPPRLTSMCQPASPGSSGEGKRMGRFYPERLR